jgi:hypothetical protein
MTLRKRITPSVPFTLNVEDDNGDKFTQTFDLAYDLNTLILIEEKLGKSSFTDLGEILDNPTATNVSILFWAAVQINHPEYAGEEGLQLVRTNLTVGTAKAAMAACSEAFVAQLPEEQVKKLKELRAARGKL